MLAQWLVPGGMFGAMLGMGLTLGLEDFQRIARMPGATVVGTLLQLVAMPLAGCFSRARSHSSRFSPRAWS